MESRLVFSPVLTARASREQLADLLPRMEPAEQLSSPGPARVLHVKLSTGEGATVVFHERAGFIEILAPLGSGLERGLAELLAELNIPPDAITWTHEKIDRDAVAAREHAVMHG